MFFLEPTYQPVAYFAQNQHGRDFAVGDIHGCFDQLQAALSGVGFDPAVDRLFCTGDLVDRGPQSHHAVLWLAYPWLHSVMGNHCERVGRYESAKLDKWYNSGGAWFEALSPAEQATHSAQFKRLPTMIEVTTVFGRVGIVHADLMADCWELNKELLQHDRYSNTIKKLAHNECRWSRKRFKRADPTVIRNIDFVVFGHNPVRTMQCFGNKLYIDTRGYDKDGFFTLLDLNTLKGVSPCGGTTDSRF